MTQSAIEYLSKKDLRLAKVIETIGPLPSYEPKAPFRFLVHEIIGQMLSDSVREVIIARFDRLCEGIITPEHILTIELHQMSLCGMSMRKCNTIRDLAVSILQNRIDLDALGALEDGEVVNVLTQIKGIGLWTSKMFLLFYLQREDILPIEDAAFMQAFRWLYSYKNPAPETVKRRCAKWSPYSSIASRYMYRALDSGLTKIPVHEFLGKL